MKSAFASGWGSEPMIRRSMAGFSDTSGGRSSTARHDRGSAPRGGAWRAAALLRADRGAIIVGTIAEGPMSIGSEKPGAELSPSAPLDEALEETFPASDPVALGHGVDDLRWLAPVRPGDAIHLEGELIELLPSATKPQGVAKIRWTAFNQRGEPVYTVTPLAIVPRRPA